MWNFQSFRESLRENARVARETAKAAAQAAQGVLQVAAAEDDESNQDIVHPTPEENTAEQWDIWSNSQNDESRLSQSTSGIPGADDILAPDSFQVPNAELPVPPPPPSSIDDHTAAPTSIGLHPRPVKQKRVRSSRYVVSGVNTTPLDPQPEFHLPQLQSSIPRPQPLVPQNDALEPLSNRQFQKKSSPPLSPQSPASKIPPGASSTLVPSPSSLPPSPPSPPQILQKLPSNSSTPPLSSSPSAPLGSLNSSQPYSIAPPTSSLPTPLSVPFSKPPDTISETPQADKDQTFEIESALPLPVSDPANEPPAWGFADDDWGVPKDVSTFQANFDPFSSLTENGDFAQPDHLSEFCVESNDQSATAQDSLPKINNFLPESSSLSFPPSKIDDQSCSSNSNPPSRSVEVSSQQKSSSRTAERDFKSEGSVLNEQSADWFDKTATQLEDISSSFEPSLETSFNNAGENDFTAEVPKNDANVDLLVVGTEHEIVPAVPQSETTLDPVTSGGIPTVSALDSDFETTAQTALSELNVSSTRSVDHKLPQQKSFEDFTAFPSPMTENRAVSSVSPPASQPPTELNAVEEGDTTVSPVQLGYRTCSDSSRRHSLSSVPAASPNDPEDDDDLNWFENVSGPELTTEKALTLEMDVEMSNFPVDNVNHREKFPLTNLHLPLNSPAADQDVPAKTLPHNPKSDHNAAHTISQNGSDDHVSWHPQSSSLPQESLDHDPGFLASDPGHASANVLDSDLPIPNELSDQNDKLRISSIENQTDVHETHNQLFEETFSPHSVNVISSGDDRKNPDLTDEVNHFKLDMPSGNFSDSTFERRLKNLQQERDAALEDRAVAERERDFAIEKGGDGLREARSAIEELRSKLDCEFYERSQISQTVRDLEALLEDSRSELKSVQTEFHHKVKLAQTEVEIAKFERQKMEETCELLRDEVSALRRSEQEHLEELTASQARVNELELQLQSDDRHRVEDAEHIESFTNQVDELKSMTRIVIQERNTLSEEKLRLENEKNFLKNTEVELSRRIADLQREVKNTTAERDEWKARCGRAQDQMKEIQIRVDMIVSERDNLMRERTSQQSKTDREKMLATECEQRARMLSTLEKNMTSLSTKIEKLTTQRNTFQRQRDDAGARLRAAGAEFSNLNTRLSELSKIKDDVQKKMFTLQDERDTALSKVQELAKANIEANVCREGLKSRETELESTKKVLSETQTKIQSMVSEQMELRSRCKELEEEVRSLASASEVLSREKQLMQTCLTDYEREIKEKHNESQALKSSKTEVDEKLGRLEREFESLKNALQQSESNAAKAIEYEHANRVEAEEKVAAIEKKVYHCDESMKEIRSAISSCLNLGKVLVGDDMANGKSDLFWPEKLTFGEDYNAIKNAAITLCEVTRSLCENLAKSSGSRKELEEKYAVTVEEIRKCTSELQEFRNVEEELRNVRGEMEEARRQVEFYEHENMEQSRLLESSQLKLEVASEKETQLSFEMECLRDQLTAECETLKLELSNEKTADKESYELVVSKLQSIWDMLQKCVGAEQVQALRGDSGMYENSAVHDIGVIALRGTALVVAEVNRLRNDISDITDKMESAELEVSRLTDRSELAEQERDALKGTVERTERKANNAHSTGYEEAKNFFDGVVSQLEDDLAECRDELRIAQDKASRCEKEVGELRALCNKLTSQLNGRTNELDETEEKLTYLQDQVSTLEEDLHEAHRRLKKAEEDSAESRRSGAERLSRELEERSAQLDTIEMECSRLREICDEAEKKAKEYEIEADTHKQAERNLQIAIEQLEAEQESAVERRTIELKRMWKDAEAEKNKAIEQAEAAAVSESQFKLRDEEIKELRGAIGRLSDERVELKLELEKSLSRLSHPDAEGHLVDRRVVRQLLISYFRVDSVRRRDVLELMSRMLAFSESDSVVVGLKRRALMDRLGSLVQAPDLDNTSLPPLGTVSDKWIEFLMKETEEDQDQERKW